MEFLHIHPLEEVNELLVNKYAIIEVRNYRINSFISAILS